MRIRNAWRAYQALDPRIWTMAVVRAINTMGLSLVMAFMAVYLVDDRGVSGSTYGIIYLIANLAQTAAHAYAGELSDRLGRRPLMVAALATRGAVIVLLGAEVLVDAPIALIAPTLIASAALRGFFEPVAYALVADVARPEERVAAFGLQRMGTNLGWAIGPAFGGFLSLIIPYGVVFFCTAGVMLFGVRATARVVDPVAERAASAQGIQTAQPAQSDAHTARTDKPSGAPDALARTSVIDAFAEALRRADVATLLLGTLLLSLTQVQIFSTLSLYAASQLHLDNGRIGLLYTVNGACVLLLQMPAIALINRMSRVRALIYGPLLLVLGFIVLGAAGDFALAAAAMVLITLAEVIIAPAHQALAAELSDPARMGRAFGMIGTVQMLGVALAPLFGGLVYDHFQNRHMLMWGILASMAVLASAVFVLFGAIYRRTLARR